MWHRDFFIQMKNTTLVLGASPNAARYSFAATRKLQHHGHKVIAFGPRNGEVADVTITQEWPNGGVDTVTMYIGPARQPEYYQRIIELNPRGVIFNPGTENTVFYEMLKRADIHVVEACTLVMLTAGNY